MACDCPKCSAGLGPTGWYRWTVDEVDLDGELVQVDFRCRVYDGMLQMVEAEAFTNEHATTELARGTVARFKVSDATHAHLDARWDERYGSVICTERNRVDGAE